MFMGKSQPTELINWITEQLRIRKWTQSELARNAGVSVSRVSAIMNGETPGLDACIAIADGLGVPVTSILVMAGLIPPLPEISGKQAEIAWVLDQLSDEDRDVVYTVAKAMLDRKRNVN